MQEVGEEEADELEGHGDHGIPDETEERTNRETFDKDFVAVCAWSQNGGFPVWRCSIGCGLFVCLNKSV